MFGKEMSLNERVQEYFAKHSGPTVGLKGQEDATPSVPIQDEPEFSLREDGTDDVTPESRAVPHQSSTAETPNAAVRESSGTVADDASQSNDVVPVEDKPQYDRNPLRLLRDTKLRTQQLKYLNLQRTKALRDLRKRISEAVKRGVDPSKYPRMPEVRSRSIRVMHLRYMFEEPTYCKWCDEELTADTLALTFDQPISQSGSPEIENVVAICKQCFFLKGYYPQWFWAKLIGWLRQENLLAYYRHYTPTWARSAAYRRHWAARSRKRVRSGW